MTRTLAFFSLLALLAACDAAPSGEAPPAGEPASAPTPDSENSAAAPAAPELPFEEVEEPPVDRCPAGGCEFKCETGNEPSCRAACDGGGCTQHCGATGICLYECGGGKCKQTCEPGSICRLSCTPGDCEREFAGSNSVIDDTKPMNL